MANKKVIIVGCGFAGLTCAIKLARVKGIDILLFDKRTESQFLPLLPDIVGRGLLPAHLKFNLVSLHKGNTRFVNRLVDEADLTAKNIYSDHEPIDYDFLVLSAGAENNFYGDNELKSNVLKLSCVDDAAAILEALNTGHFDAVTIIGGGYTGVELASSVKRHLDENDLQKNVVLIERAAALLPGFSPWEQDYIQNNLRAMGIELQLSAEIASVSQTRVVLKNSKIYNNTLVIWSAGVKAVDMEITGPVKRSPQGRIEVDDYLRIGDNVFCLGDMALVRTKKSVLRMGVQFAVAQGELCAANIVNALNGKPFKKYRPADLGYIIPMADDKGCGRVFGIRSRGLIAIFLHYCMCVYRSFTFANRVGIIKEIMLK